MKGEKEKLFSFEIFTNISTDQNWHVQTFASSILLDLETRVRQKPRKGRRMGDMKRDAWFAFFFFIYVFFFFFFEKETGITQCVGGMLQTQIHQHTKRMLRHEKDILVGPVHLGLVRMPRPAK